MKKYKLIQTIYFIALFLLIDVLPMIFYNPFKEQNYGFFQTLYFLLIVCQIIILTLMVFIWFIQILFNYIPEQIENYFKNR